MALAFRTEVRPFHRNRYRASSNPADPAVIAIENARFQEPKIWRTKQLVESVEK